MMAYKGFIKKSRTLDALAVLGMFNSIFPILQDQLPALGLNAHQMAVVNIVGAVILTVLRFMTKTPVGQKDV